MRHVSNRTKGAAYVKELSDVQGRDWRVSQVPVELFHTSKFKRMKSKVLLGIDIPPRYDYIMEICESGPGDSVDADYMAPCLLVTKSSPPSGGGSEISARIIIFTTTEGVDFWFGPRGAGIRRLTRKQIIKGNQY